MLAVFGVVYIVFGLCLRVGMILIRCVSSVVVLIIKFKLAISVCAFNIRLV